MHFSLPTLALALSVVPALPALASGLTGPDLTLALQKRALADAGAAHHQRARSHAVLARRHHARAADQDGKALVRRKKKRSTCQAPLPAGQNTTMPVAESLQAKPTSTSSVTTHSATAAHSSASSVSASAVAASAPVAPASSAAASAAPSASAPTTPNTGSMSEIFPVQGSSWWSTSTAASPALSFADAMTPLTSGKFPPTSAAPDGTLGLVANYPGGTYGYSSANGQGFSFYSPAAAQGVDVSTATEVLFTYSVYFPTGFDFVKGGKLPGLYGGTSLAAAKTCSGGRQDDRADCWSARMMFRTNGMGEFYNYFPTSAVQPAGYCSTPPMSVCNPDYGDSIGRGVFTFATGAWTTVGQRLKLNDVGQSNGEQELFVNGQSVLTLTGIQIAVKPGTHIYGIMAQTFFGGGDSSWANPNTQSAWFKDWSMTVLA